MYAVVGPPGVDRVRRARELLDEAGVSGVEVQVLRSPSVRQVREARAGRWSRHAHARRGVVVVLDDTSEGVSNAMLRALEEPPGDTVFAVVGRPQDILPTILSRCMVVPVGYPTTDEIATRLRAEGFPTNDAEMRARVSLTLDEARTGGASGAARGLVLSLVQAADSGNVVKFEEVLSQWDDEHWHLLRTYAREALTDRPRVFAESDVRSLGARVARGVLGTEVGRSVKVAVRSCFASQLSRVSHG